MNKMSDRCIYFNLKEVFEQSTLTSLEKKYKKFKIIMYTFLFLIGLLIILVKFLMDKYMSNNFTLTIVVIVYILLLLGLYKLTIYLANLELVNIFGKDSKERLIKYRTNWEGARYFQFKIDIEKYVIKEKNEFDDAKFKKLHEFLDNEKPSTGNKIWEHKVSIAWLSIVVLTANGLISILSKGNHENHILLFFIFTLLIIVYPIVHMILSFKRSQEERLHEFKRFLMWLECDYTKKS